ncbi:hypothetical protein MIR68_011220 [Amoeboaphelidium protococcarum]|nr:hypothetical protein MIR68_011220 [Amoeboaphelidium protococcarum]
MMFEESKKEKHSRVIQERLGKIESDFNLRKDQLFQQAQSLLLAELDSLNASYAASLNGIDGYGNGHGISQQQQQQYPASLENSHIHPLLKARHRELVRQYHQQVKDAEEWRAYQLGVLEKIHNSDIQQIEAEYQSERDGLKDRLVKMVESKRKKLRDERNNLAVDADLNSSLLASSFIVHNNHPQSNGNGNQFASGQINGGDSRPNAGGAWNTSNASSAATQGRNVGSSSSSVDSHDLSVDSALAIGRFEEERRLLRKRNNEEMGQQNQIGANQSLLNTVYDSNPYSYSYGEAGISSFIFKDEFGSGGAGLGGANGSGGGGVSSATGSSRNKKGGTGAQMACLPFILKDSEIMSDFEMMNQSGVASIAINGSSGAYGQLGGNNAKKGSSKRMRYR